MFSISFSGMQTLEDNFWNFFRNATKHLKIFYDIKTFSGVFSKIQLNT